MYSKYEKVNNAIGDNSRYADYIEHCIKYKYFGDSHSKTTNAHECVHGTNSELRNFNKVKNAFYVGNDNYITFNGPKIRKQDVKSYVPAHLRASRFKTYISGMPAWDDTPLYIFDEWVAYLAGLDAGIDQNVGKNTDLVMGPMEFAVYSMSLCWALQDLDKAYYDSEPNFKQFVGDQLKRTFDLVKVGMQKFPWSEAQKYYDDIVSNQAFAALASYDLGVKLG